MRPSLFHVGQAVVCVDDNWPAVAVDNARPRPAHIPRSGPVYHVERVYSWEGTWYLHLKELGPECGWNERAFAPVELLPDEALAQLLEESLEPVTA